MTVGGIPERLLMMMMMIRFGVGVYQCNTDTIAWLGSISLMAHGSRVSAEVS